MPSRKPLENPQGIGANTTLGTSPSAEGDFHPAFGLKAVSEGRSRGAGRGGESSKPENLSSLPFNLPNLDKHMISYIFVRHDNYHFQGPCPSLRGNP